MIPKFINLLRRGKPLLLHGDGQHTRRYLYAGDAAEAFDTILHKGELGQTYNVDSQDEVSNLQLAEKLLGLFGLADASASWIQHTRDRKFNDRRYAVDGSKLRKLGWQQRTRFDAALEATVDWYGKFAGWFGDIEGVLTAHPVVKGDHVVGSSAEKLKLREEHEVKLQHAIRSGDEKEALDEFARYLKVVSTSDDGKDAGVGAFDQTCEAEADGLLDQKAAPPAAAGKIIENGGSLGGGKKRKADMISSE